MPRLLCNDHALLILGEALNGGGGGGGGTGDGGDGVGGGGAGDEEMALAAYSRRFGVVTSRPMTTPTVASLRRFVTICCAVQPGCCCQSRANEPVVKGVLIDVPLKTCVAPLFQSDVTLTPGASKSTQVPKLENDAIVSVLSVAATATACIKPAGKFAHASPALLPAAQTDMIFIDHSVCTALLKGLLKLGDASDMLTSAGNCALAITYIRPATTVDTVPLPVLSRTLIEWRNTFFATPHVNPPAKPIESY